MRIEVIESSGRAERQPLLAQAYALRHCVFVDNRGWEFLRRPDGLDIDRHDAGATAHILLLERERVVGHVRLIPGGYLAVARADPARIREAAAGANICGVSRFCISPDVCGSVTRRALTACLFTAAVRHAIECGSHALMFDTDPSMTFILRVLGFALHDVGEAVPIANRLMQPVVLRLDASVLSGLPLKVAQWTQGADTAVGDLLNALAPTAVEAKSALAKA